LQFSHLLHKPSGIWRLLPPTVRIRDGFNFSNQLGISIVTGCVIVKLDPWLGA